MVEIPKVEDQGVADRNECQKYKCGRLAQFDAHDKSEYVSNSSEDNQYQSINADGLNNEIHHFCPFLSRIFVFDFCKLLTQPNLSVSEILSTEILLE